MFYGFMYIERGDAVIDFDDLIESANSSLHLHRVVTAWWNIVIAIVFLFCPASIDVRLTD
jgi:hypothetical protein